VLRFPPMVPLTPARERATLLVLAAVQFTHVVDFMIMVPLGPHLMSAMQLSTGAFATVVAVFGLSAGVAGVIATFLFDRFDRKMTLLLMFAGLGGATLACALAHDHAMLVGARLLAGAFGGLTGSIVTAIVGDVVPRERRGAGMAFVMSAFAIGQILGVPAGLWLAEHDGWNAPFLALSVLTIPVWVLAAAVLPSVREHVAQNAGQSSWLRVREIVTEPNHLRAFALVAMLTVSGMIVVPFLPAALVANAGVPQGRIFWIYVCGGLATLVSNNLIGWLGDRFGHVRVFDLMGMFAIFPVFAVTCVGPWPLPVILVATTLFMISMGARWTPSMALVTMSVPARLRGGFMSLNSAVQALFMGVAAFLSGRIVTESVDGRIDRYWLAGAVSICALGVAAILIRRLRMVDDHATPGPPAAESGVND
jgi:predicted MFS family arabinose efflux permease